MLGNDAVKIQTNLFRHSSVTLHYSSAFLRMRGVFLSASFRDKAEKGAVANALQLLNHYWSVCHSLGVHLNQPKLFLLTVRSVWSLAVAKSFINNVLLFLSGSHEWGLLEGIDFIDQTPASRCAWFLLSLFSLPCRLLTLSFSHFQQASWTLFE